MIAAPMRLHFLVTEVFQFFKEVHCDMPGIDEFLTR